jgi:para-aminobenzoate synthetase / 4-amino-4-deoxychorismate lyase
MPAPGLGLSPLAVLRLLRGDRHPFALTGVWAGGRAVLGSEPVTTRTAPADLTDVLGGGGAPRDDEARDSDPGVAFGGGWVGYLGYGVSRRVHAGTLPRCWFGYYDHVLVQDPQTGTWTFEAAYTPARASTIEARFAQLSARFSQLQADPAPYRCGQFEVTPAPAEHRRAVARAVELVHAGDLFQANITLRLEADYQGDPLDLFCHGAAALDPPYAAFLRVRDDAAIASFSPELFLRRTGSTVHTSPIKGTSARSPDPGNAGRQRAALTGSAKDRAENVMIVDLMRSDLSSVCRPGTVSVPRLTEAEAHPGVWHLVSDVRGELPSGRTDGELITATFPPGSVTGAPKVRALEVIAELEASPREVYTGAIGYRSPLAGLELSVAIRTFEFGAGRVWLGAGGGIVADSDPVTEYAECLIKAQPLIETVGGPFGHADGPVESPQAETRTLWPRPAAGIFTTLPVTGGLPDGLGAHLDRLATSARDVFGKDLPPELPGLIRDCLAAGGSGRLRIKVRPLGGPLHCEVELTDPGPEVAAVRLRVTGLPGGLGGHKWADRRLLGQRAAGLAADEQLLLTGPGGSVLETDKANVFALTGGVLRTPAADGQILPGIMRARVLAAARSLGVAVAEAPLSLAELLTADEVLVTNSIRGVLPVIAADSGAGDRRADGWRPGATTVRLAAAVRDLGRTTDDRTERARASAPSPSAVSPTDVSPAAASPAMQRRRARDGGILVIDNYDSFTYNLVDLLRAAGAPVEVVRNDEVTAAQVAGFGAAGVVISPGPCAPAEAGICVEAVRALAGRAAVLGVCLGHEAIVVAYGGRIERIAPVHGMASVIEHDGQGIFAGLPGAFPAARYHSLILVESSLPPALAVSARTAGLPMAVRHRELPVDGVQFHPESILTPAGALLMRNFLRRASATRAAS